jgi:hypothetical protein
MKGKKTVAVYHKSVPPSNKNLEKPLILKNFSIGVRAAGDVPIDVQEYKWVNSSVGVIQGWVHHGSKTGNHLELRNRVVHQQLKHGNHVIVVDSNLFLYKNTANPLHYLRYSFDGIFPNTGIYCDTNPDPARWKKVSAEMNLSLKDYRKDGNHILLCLQRNGGWSMDGYDVQAWTIDTIKQLRQYTNRPIIIRGHPGDKNARQYLDPRNPLCRIKGFANVTFSEFGRTLEQDLVGCWAVVNHNSSPVVGAAIEGYPIFVSDPVRSQCKDIANTDLSLIENPLLPDRQKWVERLAMFHWSFDDLTSGACWSHMRNFI